MKKITFVLVIAVLLTALIAAQSFAGEAEEYEVLVDELVEEGVITPEKAKAIKDVGGCQAEGCQGRQRV